MRKSMHDNTVETFITYVKNSLAYEGYTAENEMFVRGVELLKEQETEIIQLKETIGKMSW